MGLMKLPFAVLIISVLVSVQVLASNQAVRIDGDRISLNVINQPLEKVLESFAQQGIRVRIDSSINPIISAVFEYRPIDSALASLLGPYNHAIIWKKDQQASSEELRIYEIQIFRAGQAGGSQPLFQSSNLLVKEGRDGRFHVADRLLLGLAPGLSRAELEALLGTFDATVADVYAPLGIIRLQLPAGSDVEAIAEAIALVPGVKVVEPDYAHSLDGTTPASVDPATGVSPSLSSLPGGTTVAVMDSGLSGNYQNSPFVKGVYDAVSPGRLSGDSIGHGTQMSLVASGSVTPFGAGTSDPDTTPVIAIRAFDDNGLTSNYTLLRGLDYAINNEAKVVSMSWGTVDESPFLGSAMEYAARKGLIIVAAAGNTPTGKPVYPAAFDRVIGVGALTPAGEPWSQSNYGEFVSVYAPGMAKLPVGSNGSPGMYAGTSIAAAYTARRIAQILDRNPDAKMTTVLRELSRPAR